MSVNDLVDQKLHEWTYGEEPREARITIYYNIRDIPYAAIPELREPQRYYEILSFNAGSCTPKHLLLGKMYEKIGLEVLYAVYPFRWEDFTLVYPENLRRLAEDMPEARHLACRVNIDGKLTLVDATFDLPLGAAGFPVNQEWDGMKDTILAVSPCGEEKLYDSSEIFIVQSRPRDDRSLAFYNALNIWLKQLREQITSTGVP